MSAYATRSQIELISRMTAACAESGHATCPDSSDCHALLNEVEALRQQIEAAAYYDNSVPYQEREKFEPNVSWPAAALVRCIETYMAQPPWGEEAFRRSVWLTSAIARLGEKGLYADAVVRTCVAPALKRRLAFHIATAWHTGLSLSRAEMIIPSVLEPWLLTFEELTHLDPDGDRVPALEEVLVKASTGDFNQFIDEWIANTAISHIIAWRLDGALKVEVLPSDVVLPGGATATRWVFDRFSQTYMDDWQEESLAWELSYAQSPEATAKRAGIPLTLLEERPTASVLAVEAIVRRHTDSTGIVTSTAFAGVDIQEIQEQIVFLATAGDIKQAQDLARAATEKTPHHTQLRNAFAFTLIPSDPAAARSHFEGTSEVENPLPAFNIVACLLVEEKIEEAQALISALRITTSQSVRAWLWSPHYLLKQPESTVIQYYDLAEWLSEVDAVLLDISCSGETPKFS